MLRWKFCCVSVALAPLDASVIRLSTSALNSTDALASSVLSGRLLSIPENTQHISLRLLVDSVRVILTATEGGHPVTADLAGRAVRLSQNNQITAAMSKVANSGEF